MSPILFAAAAQQQALAHSQSQYSFGAEPVFPSEYYGLFPPFPENDRVFVAMSFGDRFGLRWEHVIEPGIKSAGLEPYRVDLSKVADSIPLKILRELGTCRLVFADVTSENGMRNANVMYEVGIAQAIRRPEEVLVFRSDSDALPFDIAPIFADSYKPDSGPGATAVARDQVEQAVKRAIQSVSLTRHLFVQRIVDSLDVATFEVLASYLPRPYEVSNSRLRLGKAISDPRLLSGFSRLVTLGVLRTEIPDFFALYAEPGIAKIASGLEFELSPLGQAVAAEFSARYYKGRTPTQAYGEAVRITGDKLIAAGKADKATVDELNRLAALGDPTALSRMIELRDGPGA